MRNNRHILFQFLTVLILTSMTATVSGQCIKAMATLEESCDPGKDGQAYVSIPSNMQNKCSILWKLNDNRTSTSGHVSGLPQGTYSVKVWCTARPSVVFYNGTVTIKKQQDCSELKVKVSGPTNVSIGCNESSTPVTFTASASGGRPPYDWVGDNSSNSRTVQVGSGNFQVSFTVMDQALHIARGTLKGYAKKLECSQDPNEISGPSGYDDNIRFVNATDKMNYTINFENDPDFATAPASRVKITYDVPASQNIASFRLADFGFGSHVFTVPSNVSSYSQRLDVSDSLGVWLDVTAGIDIVNHQLFWIFQSIDPATGFEPSSSQMGFLPINDSLGHGEGYVNFYILPDGGVHTGDTVGAEALIVFDDNAPIGTNVWRNTFDAVAPTSTLHATLDAQDSLYCTFSFDAQDDQGGSGVRSIETFVSVNNGAYTSIGTCHPDSTLSYALENGLLYQFMSLATDNVGNTEPFKNIADTSVNYNVPPFDLLLDGTTFYEYHPINTLIGSFVTLDDDINQHFVYELVSGEGSTDNNLFTIVNNELKTNSLFECSNRTEYKIRVRSTDIGGLSIEKTFTLSEIITHETPETYLNTEICQGESFDFHGRSLNATGSYTDTLSKSDGCDSLVTLFLTVNPTAQTPVTQSICQGESYNFFGQTLTEAGTYTQALQTVKGCDSVITLTLIVNPVYNIPTAQEICQSESFIFFGQALTEAGTYTHTLQTAKGCDSTLTLTLTVNPTYDMPMTQEICQGESFNFFGQALTEAGTYTHTLQTAKGCDSTVTLTLTVNPVYNTPLTQEICQGESFVFFGQTLTTAGTYTHTLQSAKGCDSVVTLMLTVNPTYNTPIAQEICQGESFDFFGQTLTTAGTYTHTLQSAKGCDSVVTMTLMVNPTFNTPIAQEICQGENFDFFGQTLTTAGTYNHTLQSAKGCDSVVTMTLTVNPTYNTPITAVICEGDTLSFFGQSLTTAGTYTHNLQTVKGCDSVIVLTLTVNPTYNMPLTQEICQGESLVFFGRTLTEAGTYTHSMQTTNGCDSIITLSLTVNPLYNIPIAQSICQGDTFNFFGQSLTTAGTYTHNLQTINGCDSVVALTLTVNPTFNTPTTAVICEGDTLNFFGQSLTTAGTYTHNLQTVNGCDSVVALTLTVNPTFNTSTTAVICEGDTLNFFGQSLTTAGTYTHNLQTVNGCDSVVALTLAVNPTFNTPTTAVICEGDTFSFFGQSLTTSGTYTHNMQTVNGCDSIVTLTLTVTPVFSTPITAIICEGDTLNFFGQSLTTAGTYTHNLQTINGCDSIVTLTLTVTPAFNTPITVVICDGDNFDFFGQSLTTAGTYTHNLQTVNGCDSVISLTLTVNPTFELSIFDTTIREHEYVFGDFSITPTDSGTYTYDFQYSSEEGCDSVIHLILYVLFNDGVEIYDSRGVEIFPNPTSSILNIKGEKMLKIWIHNADGQLIFTKTDNIEDLQRVDVSQFASGQYFVKVLLDGNRTVTRKFIVHRK